MQRCIQLAMQGSGYVAPNPMVGAVLVHNNRIIGEGFHRVYGGPHAEVNCIASVSSSDESLLQDSTMYVSLEPCAHHGKTPPCTDLLIAKQIPHVVIGCRDPFHAVNGRGIEKLKQAGVQVTVGILQQECADLNRRFFTYHREHRPYIILKWAQTADGKIGNLGNNRLMITGEFTNRLVHKWRSEEMGIMVGTNTAAMDNPRLTNRLWSGRNPIRILLDLNLRLPPSLSVFDGTGKTVVFNLLKHGEEENVFFYQVAEDASMVHQVANGLYHMNISSVLIEGGARWIQSFIDDGLWDEARIITNRQLKAPHGVPSPELSAGALYHEQHLQDDEVKYYRRVQP